MHFLDLIAKKGFSLKGNPERGVSDFHQKPYTGFAVLPDLVCVNISNVATWVSDYKGDDLGVLYNKVLPPFANTWFEYPSAIFHPKFIFGTYIGCYAERLSSNKTNFMLFLDDSRLGGRVAMLAFVEIVTDDQGLPVERWMRSPVQDQEAKDFMYAMFAPVFSAISFFHCKNVKIVKHERGNFKHKHSKNKPLPPMPAFHTIEIHYGKREKHVSDFVTHKGTGDQRAHLIRGHFKEYKENNKLFGKVAGTFFWPEHVAGVGKPTFADYRVHPPHPKHEGHCAGISGG